MSEVRHLTCVVASSVASGSLTLQWVTTRMLSSVRTRTAMTPGPHRMKYQLTSSSSWQASKCRLLLLLLLWACAYPLLLCSPLTGNCVFTLLSLMWCNHSVLVVTGSQAILLFRGHTGSNAEDRPYVCPVVGCRKRYKNINGIKYHAKNAHKKDSK